VHHGDHPALYESYSGQTIFSAVRNFSPVHRRFPCKVRPAEAFVLRLMERYAARIKHGKRQTQFESPILKQADDTIPMG
jgi:hypothetical protein